MTTRINRVDPMHEFNAAPHRHIPIISGYDQPTPGVKSQFVRKAEEIVSASGAIRAWSDPMNRSSIWALNKPKSGIRSTTFFISPRRTWTVDRPVSPEAGQGIAVPLFYQHGLMQNALADVWLGDHVAKLVDGLQMTDMTVDQISKQLAAIQVDEKILRNPVIASLGSSRGVEIMAFDSNAGVLVRINGELIPVPGPNISVSVERALNLAKQYRLPGDMDALQLIAGAICGKRPGRRAAGVPAGNWNQVPAV